MILYKEFENTYSKEVAGLLKQLGYDITPEELPRRIDGIKENNLGIVFIALKEESVVGCIHTMLVTRLAEGKCGEVVSLVVDESVRGLGIGKGLLDKSISWLKASGVDKVRIRCNTIRAEAHKFYLHLGYTEKKQQKVFEKTI